MPRRNPPRRVESAPAAAERVQKILARAGLASRREAEEWIRAGRVTINGETATLGSRAQGNDQVRIDGRLVRQASTTRMGTFLCNRSPGEALARPGEGDERTAMAEHLPSRSGKRYIAISPMPRIDGGLELLTADGALAVRLQRLVRRLPMAFTLRVRGELTPEQIEGILGGELDSGERLVVQSCVPAETSGEGSNRWYHVMTLGANGRELRSLVERQGAVLSRMLRVQFGALELDRTMPRGHVRALETQEIQALTGFAEGDADPAPHS